MKALGSEVLSRPDQVDEAAALSVAACLFHGFSDASRLAIVRHLVLGEHRVVDLTDHLGLAQSTVSKLQELGPTEPPLPPRLFTSAVATTQTTKGDTCQDR